MPDMNEKMSVEALAKCLGSDPETAGKWLEAYCEILVTEFRRGNSVSICGFGRFYLRGIAFKLMPAMAVGVVGFTSLGVGVRNHAT